MSKTVLAFVGMAGSGKSTCIDHLGKKGVPSVHFGSVVIEEAKRRNNGVPNEATEKKVREEFRKKDGMAAIAKHALPTIDKTLKDNDLVILDGLYSWSEYTLLKEVYNKKLVVIAVVASRRLRYERLAKRPFRPFTAEEANSRDVAEIENLEKGGPIAIADYTLTNNEKPDDLTHHLDIVLEQVGITY